jgi:GDSL-like lipase/acylhydrolase family protein
MTQPSANDSGKLSEAKLSRRDWILLPLLSLLTICLLSSSTVLTARRYMPMPKQLGDDCLVLNDPKTGARGIPNSVCLEKVPEGELTKYRFDSRGFRNDAELGPKLPGSFRIVLLGNSMVAGFRVPYQETFAVLLPQELSQLTGRKVELYNEGIPFQTLKTTDMHFDEALTAKPDMILWLLGAPETLYASQMLPSKPKAHGPFAGNPARVWITRSLDLTSVRVMLQHFLYESQSLAVKNYLKGPEAGYLKADPDAEWRSALQDFDKYFGDMEARANAAGVPLAVVLLPYRAHAAMISMGEWPVGYDPYKFDEQMRRIVMRHGGTYIDILPDYRKIPNPEKDYFPVDGHPNAEGHAIIAGMLSRELTSGAIPALTVNAQSQVLAQRR